jgi:hypothetical protein
MDGSLVLGFRLVCTSRTFNQVSRDSNTFFTIHGDERYWFIVRRMFEIEEEIGPHAIHPFMRHLFTRNILILENHGGRVNGVGVKFGTGRDGIVPWLEAWNGRYDDIERDFPLSGVFRGGQSFHVIACGQLENFA